MQDQKEIWNSDYKFYNYHQTKLYIHHVYGYYKAFAKENYHLQAANIINSFTKQWRKFTVNLFPDFLFSCWINYQCNLSSPWGEKHAKEGSAASAKEKETTIIYFKKQDRDARLQRVGTGENLLFHPLCHKSMTWQWSKPREKHNSRLTPPRSCTVTLIIWQRAVQRDSRALSHTSCPGVSHSRTNQSLPK